MQIQVQLFNVLSSMFCSGILYSYSNTYIQMYSVYTDMYVYTRVCVHAYKVWNIATFSKICQNQEYNIHSLDQKVNCLHS